MRKMLAVLCCAVMWAAHPASAAVGDGLAPAPFAPPGRLDGNLAGVKAPHAWRRLDAPVSAVVVAGQPLTYARGAGFVVRDDRVQVIVETAGEEAAAAVARWLEDAGSLRVSFAFGRVQADVSVETLRLLADHPDVKAVRRPELRAASGAADGRRHCPLARRRLHHRGCRGNERARVARRRLHRAGRQSRGHRRRVRRLGHAARQRAPGGVAGAVPVVRRHRRSATAATAPRAPR